MLQADLIRNATRATDDGDHHPPISDWAAKQVLRVFLEQHPVIIAARRVAEGYTVKMGGVIDANRHCIPYDNANQMRDLKAALEKVDVPLETRPKG